METELRPYFFWNRASRQIWPKQLLLHIGSKEQGTVLCGVPRDIVRKIAWQLIDAETNELMAESKSDDPLVLE